MDICHLKNAEFEPTCQKYKSRVVLRGGTVKDDSGACAVFTVQGSSASQLTAALVMDVIARPPRSAGQAADAVSAYTQVQMEDAPKNCSEFPSLNVHIYKYIYVYGYVFHDTNGPNLGQTLKIQWFLLNESYTDIHLLASCTTDSSRKF